MPFLDIAFEAELNRFEDPEFEEIARRNCNEDPDTKQKAIQELRFMIYERGECKPRRTDDAYLLRFLRCRRFIPALAHKLMLRYETFRKNSAHLYDCDVFGLTKVKHIYAGTIPESPDHGRVVLMRFGRWENEVVSLDDVLRCALVMDEIGVQQPRLQILGLTMVLDLEGLSIRQVSHLTPTTAYQMASMFGVNFPIMVHGVHVINYNRVLSPFFYLFKQVTPKAIWSHVHFHGYDMASLHQYVDPKYLPPEYGGSSKYTVSCETWLSKIDKYKDDFLVQELRDLGFTVKN